jgi:hypothetical protein
LAIEMALAIGASHIFYRTGHRGMFFVDAARRVCTRVRQVGLTPFAWINAHCEHPNAEAGVAIKSIRVGYEGVIFDVGEEVAGKTVGATAIGRRLMEAGIQLEKLYYASFPNIWQHSDIPYQEMNEFCKGGFMPRCFPSFQRTPRTVVDKWAYGEYTRWANEWGTMPPIYPILAAHQDAYGFQRLGPQEFLEWAETLAANKPPFFSVYRVDIVQSELWTILAAIGAPPPIHVQKDIGAAPLVEAEPVPPALPEVQPEPTPSPVAETVAGPAPSPQVTSPPAPAGEEPAPTVLEAPEAVFHDVTVNDSVWSLCERYSITRDQFWEWNGHMWDERGLPRDGLYMQEGWRVRVE